MVKRKKPSKAEMDARVSQALNSIRKDKQFKKLMAKHIKSLGIKKSKGRKK